MFSFITDPVTELITAVTWFVGILLAIIAISGFLWVMRTFKLFDNWRIPAFLKSKSAQSDSTIMVRTEDGFAIRQKKVWTNYVGFYIMDSTELRHMNWKKVAILAMVILIPDTTVQASYMSYAPATAISNAGPLQEWGIQWVRPSLDSLKPFSNGGFHTTEIKSVDIGFLPTIKGMVDYRTMETSDDVFNCSTIIFVCGKRRTEGVLRKSQKFSPMCDWGDVNELKLAVKLFGSKPCPSCWPTHLIAKTSRGDIKLTDSLQMMILAKSTGISIVDDKSKCDTDDCMIVPRGFLTESITLDTVNQTLVTIPILNGTRVKRFTCDGFGLVGLYSHLWCSDTEITKAVDEQLRMKLKETYGAIEKVFNKVVDWTGENNIKLQNATNALGLRVRSLQVLSEAAAANLAELESSAHLQSYGVSISNQLSDLSNSILRVSDLFKDSKSKVVRTFEVDSLLQSEKTDCLLLKKCPQAWKLLERNYPEISLIRGSGWDSALMVSYAPGHVNISIMVPSNYQLVETMVPVFPNIFFKSQCLNNLCKCCVLQTFKTLSPIYLEGTFHSFNFSANDSFDHETDTCTGVDTGPYRISTENNCAMMHDLGGCQIGWKPCEELLTIKNMGSIKMNISFVPISAPVFLQRKPRNSENDTISVNLTDTWKIKSEVASDFKLLANMLSNHEFEITRVTKQSDAVAILVFVITAYLVIEILGKLFIRWKRLQAGEFDTKGLFIFVNGEAVKCTVSVEHQQFEYYLPDEAQIVTICSKQPAAANLFISAFSSNFEFKGSKECSGECLNQVSFRKPSVPIRMRKMHHSPAPTPENNITLRMYPKLAESNKMKPAPSAPETETLPFNRQSYVLHRDGNSSD